MGKNGNVHPTRIFHTPNELLTAWNEYKADVKEQSNEWLRVQYVGKEGQRMEDAQKVPYTYEGFKRFCRDNYGEVQQYFDNPKRKDSDTEGYYDEFIEVCSRVKEEIRENQIVGGMLGFYNPSITQRLNSLVDKKETGIKGSINIPNLPDIGNRK